ncbi:OsmC family protein [Candidatus Bipolaricaulota bacterium]|nr:OsmC family protein [Candidatus Bipolaricaulota bacterium]
MVVSQQRGFVTTILSESAAPSPEDGDQHNTGLRSIAHIHEITPYGMLLVSPASCTAIIITSYAQHHDLSLREVAIDARDQRTYVDDGDGCEHPAASAEEISLPISLRGKLLDQDQDRLMAVARRCPIHEMLQSGVPIRIEAEHDT